MWLDLPSGPFPCVPVILHLQGICARFPVDAWYGEWNLLTAMLPPLPVNLSLTTASSNKTIKQYNIIKLLVPLCFSFRALTETSQGYFDTNAVLLWQWSRCSEELWAGRVYIGRIPRIKGEFLGQSGLNWGEISLCCSKQKITYTNEFWNLTIMFSKYAWQWVTKMLEHKTVDKGRGGTIWIYFCTHAT